MIRVWTGDIVGGAVMVSAMLDDAMDGVVEAVGAALTLVATGFALPLVLVLETLEEEELVDLEGMVVVVE